MTDIPKLISVDDHVIEHATVWSDRLPAVVRWIEALATDTALLDGELVALRPDGVTSSTLAARSGMPPSLAIGSFGSVLPAGRPASLRKL